MIAFSNNWFEVIELTHIPMDIEHKEEEKISLSNLILEFLRKPVVPSIQLELICTSCAVSDQLQAGWPHLYIAFFYSPIDDYCYKENIKKELKMMMTHEIDSLLSVLHRMGYQTSRYSTIKSLQEAKIIPEGLFNKDIFLITNSEEQTKHQPLSVGVPMAFDNLITMMTASIPDSLLSIKMKGQGDNVGLNIQVLSMDEYLSKLIYFNFFQGIGDTCVPLSTLVKIGNVNEYWGNISLRRGAYQVISYKELSDVLQLPTGTRCGIPVAPQQRKLPLFESGLINGHGFCVGTVIGTEDKKLTLPLQDEVTHMSVLGISGSGKSNFLLYYLNEMYNAYGIPFLVIDPVSTEYRELKGSIKNIRLNVFTPGSETSPFEFNLFALSCKNLTVREYKSVLKDYLRNCMNLFSPLDKLIDETIDTIFLEKGWFDISTSELLKGELFTIRDFILTFNKVFEKSKFTGNLKNIAASGKVRLESLCNYFDTVATLPLEEILTVPTILELGKLQSAEAKSTMLLYLLNMVKLYMMNRAAEFRKKGEVNSKRPCLILVIDEAHSILEMQEQGEGMNVAQRGVVDTINQMLLEYRKYGLSVVVADQRVSVLQDVLTNTHMQVIFKQIDPNGKQIAADIISLDEVQMLAGQKTGEAFVKHQRLELPVQVKTPFYEKTPDSHSSDEDVKEYMNDDFWMQHPELTRPFKECKQYCRFKTCQRNIRSIVENIVAKYLHEEKPSKEDLKEMLVDKDNHKVKQLIEKGRIKLTPYFLLCLKIHLMNAAKYLPQIVAALESSNNKEEK